MDAALNTNERQGHWCSLFLHPPTLNTPEGDTQSASLCLLQPLTLFTILSDEQSEEQKGFSSRFNPVDKKGERRQRFNVSQSLSSWVTTADVTFSRVGTEPLLSCAPLHMSFRIISGHGTVAVWESWSGGRLGIKGRKRERAETQG